MWCGRAPIPSAVSLPKSIELAWPHRSSLVPGVTARPTFGAGQHKIGTQAFEYNQRMVLACLFV